MNENEIIVFREQYDSLLNGNISSFKEFLDNCNGEHIYNFIKWLQAEGLKI